MKYGDLYLRNIVFGVSDSLVSTVGLLSGIDVSGASRSSIILTGVIYAFVEGFSMAVGSFLSEKSAEEYLAAKEVKSFQAILGGIVIFLAFLGTSLIPILPYMFLPLVSAFIYSIILSIIALFVVGIISAKVSHVSLLGRALKMSLLGGGAIILGVLIGKVV